MDSKSSKISQLLCKHEFHENKEIEKTQVSFNGSKTGKSTDELVAGKCIYCGKEKMVKRSKIKN